MDIFEFELRWRAYEGLSSRFDLKFSQDQILNLVKIAPKKRIDKKLQDLSPEELKELTLHSYTNYKKDFLHQAKNKIIKKNFSLSDYIERLEYELTVIDQMGYNTYFLIVQDYINWAKQNKIAVGPGRGSAAGSLLAYLIGITDLDPLEYDLLFERFLNPARVSMPDIDTDFEDIKRDDLIEYVKQKYGKEKVALIGTYMTMAAKAAFKDVARAMGMPFEQANKITEFITDKTIIKSLETNESFRELVESDEEIKKIVEFASRLEGTIRQTGVHACGVIIAPDPVVEYTPIQYPLVGGGKQQRDTSRIVTQYDGHYLEDIGLLKMDFLGLRNLSIIKNTIKIIKAKLEKGYEYDTDTSFVERYFEKMGFYPPLDDNLVYKTVFQTGNTSGVFQFESDGMRRWLKELKPTNIDDIIAMVALYRPGPMDFIPSYIKRKYGEEKVQYLPDEVYNLLKQKYGQEVAEQQKKQITDDLSPFMNVTYGIPIYQEQLMRIVQAMAGFSLGEADLLRRGVGKKIKEIIDKLKKDFIERAESFKGYKPEVSQYVYEKMIEPAANYSFNKSHAACYAFIAYQTAWLKTHFPLEFHASLLRSVEEDTDKLSKFIEELKLAGFKILPPDVNQSFVHIAALEDSIILGFLSIKGLGYEVSKHIQQERIENGPYKDLEDFLKRNKDFINKKTLEALAKSGVLSRFENTTTILANIDNILNWLKNSTQAFKGLGLFGTDQLDIKLKLDKKEENFLDKLKYEYEIYKTFVGAHPFDGLFKWIKSKYNFISMFKNEEEYGDFKILAIVKDIRKIRKKGVWIDIEDVTDTLSLFIKDNFDIKKFDILEIHGYKGKSSIPRLNVIYKINLSDLLEKAKKAGKFDNESIFSIRARRGNGKDKIQLGFEECNFTNENKTKNCSIVSLENNRSSGKKEDLNIKNNNKNGDEKKLFSGERQKKDEIDEYTLELPEDIEKICQICKVLKKDGKYKVIINGNIYKTDSEDLIKFFCKKK